MSSSPVKRRKSFSSYEDIQRSCRKKLTYEADEKKPRRNTLLIAVLRRNYKKRVIEEAAMERQKVEASQKKNRLIFIRRSKSLNYGQTPTKKQEDLSENYKKLKEKTDYVKQLEVEFNDAKAKRQKTEEEEERLKSMLKVNKNYLQSLYQQFKVLAAHKKAKSKSDEVESDGELV